jgi:hypothetical protein
MAFHLTVPYATVLRPSGTRFRSSGTAASVVVDAAVASVLNTSPVLNTTPAFRASCYAGRAVASAMELTTVPTVVHTYVFSSWGTEVLSVTIVVTAISMDMPGMSATIGGIEVRTSEVEVITMRIAGVDAEVPVASLPIKGTVEIAGCNKGIPLPVEEDITQIEVATLPVDAKHIGATCHTHQIVEVDLVTSLVLLVAEVELIGHLIGQEQSLVAGLLETHGGGRDCDCQHRHQGHQHLFHNRIF